MAQAPFIFANKSFKNFLIMAVIIFAVLLLDVLLYMTGDDSVLK